MTPSRPVTAMARTTQSPVPSLWMTVWQARYRDGDAGGLPSPLRREVPGSIGQASPAGVALSPQATAASPGVRATSPRGTGVSPGGQERPWPWRGIAWEQGERR